MTSSTSFTGLTSMSTGSVSFMNGMNLSGNGYLYYVNEMPSGSLDHGQNIHFQIFIGLGDGSQNTYQDSSPTLPVTIAASSDPQAR